MGLLDKILGRDKKEEIIWNENGWTKVQDADAAKHVLEISCKAVDGKVTEVRIRHNDGEDFVGKAYVDGKSILPIGIDEFKKLYTEGKIELK